MPQHLIIKRDLLLEPPMPLRAMMGEQQMDELVASIRTLGILEPLLVTPSFWRTADGVLHATDPLAASGVGSERTYEIIDGHRRYLASGMAGLSEVPCIVFDDVADTKLQIMVDATMVREDVTAAEEGLLFLQLCEQHGWSIDQLCDKFKRSEGYINQRVMLVRGDPKIAESVARREITFGVARILLQCKDEDHRRYLLDMARTHGSNTRTVELWLTQWKQQQAIQSNGGATVQLPPSEPIPAPEPPRCLWCTRDDNPEDMVPILVHRWHVTDLLAWLQRTGVHETPTLNSPPESGSVPAARSL